MRPPDPAPRVTREQWALTSATSAVEQELPPPASNPALGRPPVASLAEGPTLKILAPTVASVVVVQLPASAGGVPVALAKGVVRPFASGVMAPLAAYLASERDAASAVMARQADLLVHAGVPRPAVLAEAATARDGATVTFGSSTTVAVVAVPAELLGPAGDVKRDGVRDVTPSSGRQ